jgi:hypothetical protein
VVALARIQTMRRLHKLSVVAICLAASGCGSNIGALQSSPAAQYYSGSQSHVESRSSDQMTGAADRAGSLKSVVSEISISDLSTGSVSKVVFDKSYANAATAIHNGSDVSVQLETQSNVTGVIVDGDALTPTALRRVSSGHWQGTFQYWDGSNTRNSKSKITVMLILPKNSISTSFFVSTVHDS